jgi:hypothetical protein
MSNLKSWIAILMGVIILAADVSWLVIGSSYTYGPWLTLGIIIFIAGAIWIGLDYSLMREAQRMIKSERKVEESNLRK